ncbi:hypothetical protein [Clostridium tyrobutyricum]|uniref:hypothetical protein n=1 Tax=Clostridium tyrobutyricum TaxID=1519 RepID=UPI001C38EAA3|nr:hypothetical protein [Clostridium tyrobutyricum]MBV4439313.1 hypothetical protein [Clostridium tyrobutyricum]
MTLEFKTKEHPKNIKQESIDLGNFLIKNKNYFDIICKILYRRVAPINQIEKLKERIELFTEYDQIKNDNNYNDFKSLLFNFYNTDISTLNDRRGDFLEFIVREAYPPNCNKNNCERIFECVFYNDGNLIDECNMDIDVVFKYEQIDLIECKASLKAYLKPPDRATRDKRKKLQLMYHVKNIVSEDIHINSCNLFFATLAKSSTYERSILGSWRFPNIDILTYPKIKNRM